MVLPTYNTYINIFLGWTHTSILYRWNYTPNLDDILKCIKKKNFKIQKWYEKVLETFWIWIFVRSWFLSETYANGIGGFCHISEKKIYVHILLNVYIYLRSPSISRTKTHNIFISLLSRVCYCTQIPFYNNILTAYYNVCCNNIKHPISAMRRAWMEFEPATRPPLKAWRLKIRTWNLWKSSESSNRQKCKTLKVSDDDRSRIYKINANPIQCHRTESDGSF